jgi:hypothetical protein
MGEVEIAAGWGGRIRTCECRYQKQLLVHFGREPEQLRSAEICEFQPFNRRLKNWQEKSRHESGHFSRQLATLGRQRDLLNISRETSAVIDGTRRTWLRRRARPHCRWPGCPGTGLFDSANL